MQNEFGQTVGRPLPEWRPVVRPPATALSGRYVDLEPVAPGHAAALFASVCREDDESLWTYRSDDRPRTPGEAEALVDLLVANPAWTSYAVVPRGGAASGLISLLRDDPANGSIEVGGVLYARALQRTPATTEATWLLARHVFGLGYRRFEWKLDSLNAPSAAAARRLGFTEQGLFVNHMVYKGRNRDTQWFAIVDQDWPLVDAGLQAWLDPANFDEHGRQREPLADLRARLAIAAG